MPGRQIDIRHARINGRVRVPDALQCICGCGSTHEAAAEVALGLAGSYAEAPNMHTIILT
jgi:hypothetical protein